jgi:hypothetical protein
MSHIRDLGNKASQLSTSLHQGIRGQNYEDEDEDVLFQTASLDNNSDSDLENVEAGLYNADEEDDSSGMERVRVDATEHTSPITKNTDVKQHTAAQDDVQPRVISTEASEVSIQPGESSATNTNYDSLELARARLLAQLGDNLVQTGMPASVHASDSTEGSQLSHSAQAHHDPDDSQHETRFRALPSRAEAERQRQLMRTRSSATHLSSEEDPSCRINLPESTPVVETRNSSSVDLNTRVTIDMILTVVAECYGQRDLLVSRQPW